MNKLTIALLMSCKGKEGAGYLFTDESAWLLFGSHGPQRTHQEVRYCRDLFGIGGYLSMKIFTVVTSQPEF